MRLLLVLTLFLLLALASGNSLDRLKVSDHVTQLKRALLERDDISAADRISIINEEAGKDLYEGDIVLNKYDKHQVDLRDDGDVDGPLATAEKRNAQRARKNLWLTKKVPYEIHSVFGPEYKTTIHAAIKEFKDNTCIEWIPKRSSDSVWVKFVQKSGCFSSVGRNYWKSGQFQELSLGAGCNHKGTVMHEMMHAVGFWHEQSRPDRNQYIEVLWENIQKGKQHNFNKYSHGIIDTLNVKYDFKSLMHYGRDSFATGYGLRTIQAIDNPNRQLGQRNGFSEIDIVELNALYDCSNTKSGYSAWSQFGPCDSNCNHIRQRFCSHEDKSKCPGADKYGIQSETVKCPASKCYAPVPGHWGRWSAWASCSVSCGKGTKTRTRKCDDPVPKNGGPACVGSVSSSAECELKRCGLGPDDCEFDNDNFCFWVQDKSDTSAWDWIRHTAKTSSSNTGPNADHTSGKGHYIYFESSSPVSKGQYSRLISKEFPTTSGRCMTFWYHMFGVGIGSLVIRQKDASSGKLSKIWEKDGEQGNEWKKGNVTLKSSGSYRIILEAVRGIDFRGDIGLDDVFFKDGVCGSKLVQPSATASPASVSTTCNFDKNQCGWEKPLSNYKWLRHTGATATANTGPAADHTTGTAPYTHIGCYGDGRNRALPEYLRAGYGNAEKCYQAAKAKGYKAFGLQYHGECWTGPNALVTYNKYGTSSKCSGLLGGGYANDIFVTSGNAGYYMYLPAAGFPQGSKAQLKVGKNFQATQSQGDCHSFWYNMNGANVGTLNVYANTGSQEHKVWSMSGNQGKEWKNVRLTLKIQAEYRIIVEGVRGNGNAGDIAIDDFSFKNSPC